ncbi:AAA family ATPase [Streptomyces sp. NPDC047097]|uniref:helix-turn-helix transcriptional regulator n=1 Tax=Streptomyces sp. NPDC047097 TaxID=3155260 RepID=UPI0033F1DDAF
MSGSGMLVERDGEVEAFRLMAEELRSGRGGLVAVEGPAGIGKTRLLDEIVRHVEQVGGRVLSARATELERALPMGLVQQLFESLLEGCTHEERERWLSGAARPASAVVGRTDRKAADDAVAGDFAILHGLYWLTANVSRERPLLLVVDDAHWADPASLRFLAYLLPRVRDLPVLVAVGTRPNEPGAETRLLDHITGHHFCRLLRPRPLSRAGSARMLRSRLEDEADPEFLDACYTATGGNPLFLESLVSVVDEHWKPVAKNATLVAQVGSDAVAHRVRTRLAALPAEAARLAWAVAVLGESADLTTVAALTGLPPLTTAEGIGALRRIELLQTVDAGTLQATTPLRFVHPLVRTAVYHSFDRAELTRAHGLAVDLLTGSGATAIQVATHLLRIPAGGDQRVVALLRQAASEALQRGSAESAHIYLQRALAEPPSEQTLTATLMEAGSAAMQVDLPASAECFTRALDRTADVHERAGLAVILSMALHYLSRTAEGVVVAREAREALPADDTDLRRMLDANLLCFPPTYSEQAHLSESLPELISLPPADTLGARALEAMIAGLETWRGDPAAVRHARSALADGRLRLSNAQAVITGAWLSLLVADHDQEAMDAMDSAVEEARRGGSLAALPIASIYRSLGWLWRGQLAEAESEVREVLRLMDLMHHGMARPVALATLTWTLMEQGRLEEAGEVLSEVDVDERSMSGLLFWFLDAKAQFHRLNGEYDEAYACALKSGEVFASHGGDNPASVPWRSEAALSLRAMDRREEALALIEKELALARRWGAPRALGRALRVGGVVAGPEDGVDRLREAVRVLAPGPARLEYATSLVELGSALRHRGQRGEARDLLGEGRAIAEMCGALPLSHRASTELAASGGRPRRVQVSGPDSLTPSERRVADLAAGGANNRDIAQTLFITPKTVEAHLTSAYRKLRVTSRHRLAEALGARTSQP